MRGGSPLPGVPAAPPGPGRTVSPPISTRRDRRTPAGHLGVRSEHPRPARPPVASWVTRRADTGRTRLRGDPEHACRPDRTDAIAHADRAGVGSPGARQRDGCRRRRVLLPLRIGVGPAARRRRVGRRRSGARRRGGRDGRHGHGMHGVGRIADHAGGHPGQRRDGPPLPRGRDDRCVGVGDPPRRPVRRGEDDGRAPLRAPPRISDRRDRPGARRRAGPPLPEAAVARPRSVAREGPAVSERAGPRVGARARLRRRTRGRTRPATARRGRIGPAARPSSRSSRRSP